MPLRKGKLHCLCTKCGKPYPKTTVRPGICSDCKSESALDKMVKLQLKVNAETRKHNKIIKKQKATRKNINTPTIKKQEGLR